MQVKVSIQSSGPRVTLADSDNFREFVVIATNVGPVTVRAAVVEAGAGELVGRHVWIRRDYIEANASEVTSQWQAQFEAMVELAAEHGWVSADGSAIRAHIDYRSERF